MTDDLNGVSEHLPLETDFVSCFPDRPTYICNTNSKELLPIGNPFLAPLLALLIGRWDIIGTQAGGNCSPYHLANRTCKQEMIYSFRVSTEITRRITIPISFDHVVLS